MNSSSVMETQIVGTSGQNSSSVELQAIDQGGQLPPHTASPPPPLTAQGAQIEQALKNSNPKVGDLWFILPLNWWEKWAHLTQFKCWPNRIQSNFIISSIDEISAIPTDSIIDQWLTVDDIEKILNQVIMQQLYVSMPIAVWEMLVKWYGLNGPEIKRPIKCFLSTDSGIPVVSVDPDPFRLFCILQSEKHEKKRIIISKRSTVKTLKKKLISIFDVDGTECHLWQHLWDFYNGSVYEDLEKHLDESLEDAKLLDDQDILLDDLNEVRKKQIISRTLLSNGDSESTNAPLFIGGRFSSGGIFGGRNIQGQGNDRHDTRNSFICGKQGHIQRNCSNGSQVASLQTQVATLQDQLATLQAQLANLLQQKDCKKDGNAEVKFIGQEFNNVFERIHKKQKKEGYYILRLLNKFHRAKFDDNLDSDNVDFQNLKSQLQWWK